MDTVLTSVRTHAVRMSGTGAGRLMWYILVDVEFFANNTDEKFGKRALKIFVFVNKEIQLL